MTRSVRYWYHGDRTVHRQHLYASIRAACVASQYQDQMGQADCKRTLPLRIVSIPKPRHALLVHLLFPNFGCLPFAAPLPQSAPTCPAATATRVARARASFAARARAQTARALAVRAAQQAATPLREAAAALSASRANTKPRPNSRAAAFVQLATRHLKEPRQLCVELQAASVSTSFASPPLYLSGTLLKLHPACVLRSPDVTPPTISVVGGKTQYEIEVSLPFTYPQITASDTSGAQPGITRLDDFVPSQSAFSRGGLLLDLNFFASSCFPCSPTQTSSACRPSGGRRGTALATRRKLQSRSRLLKARSQRLSSTAP